MERHAALAALDEYLALSTMTLATCGADGQPHAAAVYFAADHDLRLHFFSNPDSRHSRHLAADPRAAATIQPQCFDWQDIRGLQISGEVIRLEAGQTWDTVWQIYLQKFPFTGGLKDIVARNQMYAFIPRWVRLVDNRQGFGFKQEWHLK
ncbi:MAG: pyridoxamine 5'-phosphate oxidase family protein [Anaerolineales bacterium]